jgi:hypothetical protein
VHSSVDTRSQRRQLAVDSRDTQSAYDWEHEVISQYPQRIPRPTNVDDGKADDKEVKATDKPSKDTTRYRLEEELERGKLDF